MTNRRWLLLGMAVFVALGTTACEFVPVQGGAPLLRQVSDELVAGDIEGAEAYVRRHVPDPGPDPTTNLDAWCAEPATRRRLEDRAASAARSLIEAYRSGDDALTRYALASDSFDRALRSEDEGLDVLCAESPDRISTLDFDRARRPIAEEMRRILEPLQQAAPGAKSNPAISRSR